MTTTEAKTTKKTTKKVTKKGSSESVKAQKMKSKTTPAKPNPAAVEMIRKETVLALRDRLYSAQMVGAVARNHGLDRAGAEASIRAVCDPIIEQLENPTIEEPEKSP